MMKILLAFVLVVGAGIFTSSASMITANSNGYWNQEHTWFGNFQRLRLPGCGDTVVIPASTTVIVGSQEDYFRCEEPVNIFVYGRLHFIHGNKIDLPCGSCLRVFPGGVVSKITPGGGNSSLLSICKSVEWAAGDGDLIGPIVICLSPLPVSLLSFEVEETANAVTISWQTASEVNNDYFMLQRSDDNISYSDVKKVSGAGTSSEFHSYMVSDHNPGDGIVYYRLGQVDYDGKSVFYGPRILLVKGKNDILVYPNPASADNLNLFYKGSRTVPVTLQLVDITGKIVFQEKSFPLHSGENKVIPGFIPPPGTYFVSVLMEDEIFRQKLVIAE